MTRETVGDRGARTSLLESSNPKRGADEQRSPAVSCTYVAAEMRREAAGWKGRIVSRNRRCADMH
jgi:hypothetical protein